MKFERTVKLNGDELVLTGSDTHSFLTVTLVNPIVLLPRQVNSSLREGDQRKMYRRVEKLKSKAIIHILELGIEAQQTIETEETNSPGDMENLIKSPAIVGLGCKLPGANNTDEFWKLLEAGENHVTDIPRDRWNTDAFYSEDRNAIGKTYARTAGLLKDPLAFDNSLFYITDEEADMMDPQQRLVLECVHMALEDGGFTRDQIRGSRTGVFIGVMTDDYRGETHARSSHINHYTVTGTSNSVIANRVSYTFDLRGPSMAIDTACSSSLVAVDVGIQALLSETCDLAICGGVNFLLSPDPFVLTSKAGMLSRKGQCFTFSQEADGYTRGEGCGIVILQRLSDATRDNNRVWATILTRSNHNGRTVSPITAPSDQQQAQLLNDLYTWAKVDPQTIDYIEAHGTGTRGDIVEVKAFEQFFKEKKSLRHRYIGSVKTNIGHLEAAAGIAGLIKVLLMMKYGKIVPSLLSEPLHKQIDFQAVNLHVPTQVKDWPLSDKEQKMACVNSFGFGGANCHAIVRAKHSPRDRQNSQELPCVTCFSARNKDSLIGSIKDFLAYPNLYELALHDIAYTSTVRRQHFQVRYAVVTKTVDELTKKLKKFKSQEHKTSKVLESNLVFVFCGMGSYWLGMCRGLMNKSDVFRKAIQDIDHWLSQLVTWTLEHRLMTTEVEDDREYQPIAIFACQVGLAKLWESLGVCPRYVVGHSVGEVAAAYVAGRLSLQDAVKVIVHRTQALARVAGGGTMILFRNLPVDEIKDIVKKFPDKANVSVELSPVCCAVSGNADAVKEISHFVQTKAREFKLDVTITDMRMPVAYHSHIVDSCKEELRQALKDVAQEEKSPHSSHIEMISTVTAETVKGRLGGNYWVQNMRDPVQFLQAIRQTVHSSRRQIFLEVGPKPFLATHQTDIFPQKETKTVTSMSKTAGPEMEWGIFLKAVANLYEEGVTIKFGALPQVGTSITPVPRYCFKPRRVLELPEAFYIKRFGANDMIFEHPFLLKSENSEMEFQVLLSPLTFSSVYEHRIGSDVILPGALYAELGFAVTKQVKEMNCPQYSVAVDLVAPCLVENRTLIQILEVIVVKRERDMKSSESFDITVKAGNNIYAKIHLRGLSKQENKIALDIPSIKSRCSEEIKGEGIDYVMKKLGFHYGPNYSLFQSGQKGPRECLAKVQVPDKVRKEMLGMTVHPSVLDAMIQICAIVTESPTEKDAYGTLPTSIGSLLVFGPAEQEMYIHSLLKQIQNDITVFDAQLTNLQGEVLAQAEDLTFKSLTTDTSEMQAAMLYLQTPETWLPEVENYSLELTDDNSVLYIVDKNDFPGAPTPVNVITYDVEDNGAHVHVGELLNCKSCDNYKVMIFSASASVTDNDVGTYVLSKLANLCMIMKTIYTLHSVSSLPVYVFTQWAVDATGSLHSDGGTNPLLTALWSLTKCALREGRANVSLLDLHLPKEKITLQLLAAVVRYIQSDPVLGTYTEWLVKEDVLLRMAKEDVLLHMAGLRAGKLRLPPMWRSISTEPSQTVLSVFKNPEISPDNVNAYCRTHQTHLEGFDEVNISETAIPDTQFFNMALPYSDVIQSEEASLVRGHCVFALEHVGTVKGSHEKVVSCYPSLVASKVKVPVDAVVPQRLFEDYRPGNLTTLVFLRSLLQHLNGSSVTIIVSKTTESFGILLTLILMDMIASDELHGAQIVDKESLDECRHFNNIIVSMVYLEHSLLLKLKDRSSQFETLITVPALAGSNLQAFLQHWMPKVKLILQDPAQVFSADSVEKLCREVKIWMEENPHLKFAMSACLHSNIQTPDERNGFACDLGELLTTERFKADRSKVQATRTDQFRKDAVYIVVGGLTGLGWEFVKFLAQNGAGIIIILNRRTASRELRAEIRKLCENHSCEIEPFPVDVTQMTSLRNVMASIYTKFPDMPLKGIFFGAAVLDDRLLHEMDGKAFKSVLAPKVLGAWNLHQLTKTMSLDYFVLQSSITSVVGNYGQSGYGAANGFLDGLAHYRRHFNLAGQSINWGPLDLGLLDNNDKAKEALDKVGFLLLTKDEVRASLFPVLMFDQVQIVNCKFKKNVRTGSFEELRARVREQVPLQEAGEKSQEERLELYEKYLVCLISKILSVDDETLSKDSRLMDIGMDSFLVVTLVNEIDREIHCKLSPVTLMDGNPSLTLTDIAKKIDKALHQ